MEPEGRQQNVATASTKSVATMPPKRKTLNKNDLKGEILSRVRGGVKPLPRGLRAEGIEEFRTDGQRVPQNHLSPRGLEGL